MQIGEWYVQKFSDRDLYFLPVAEQKNGGYSGYEVTVDHTRRGRPKAVKSSVRSGPYGSAAHWSVHWRHAGEVPEKVTEGLAHRFPEIAMARAVMRAPKGDVRRRHAAVRIPKARRVATSRKFKSYVAKGYSPSYAAKKAYHPSHDPKLTASQRRHLKASQFALPARRQLPIHNRAHVRNAAARLEQMRRRGTITMGEYREAKRRVLRAEKKLGIGRFHK